MDLYQGLIEKKENLAVLGLGYVGIPIAVAFAKKVSVIGFDINKEKVETYLQGIDPTNEVGNETIKATTIKFTYDEADIRNAKFIIVAVPTPVNQDHTPDLTLIEAVSRTIGRNISKGSIVVYESTVYPGVTEELCAPIIEKESGLCCGRDFWIGYSPERINPGDKEHRLDTIVKIVAGMDEEITKTIARVYGLVVNAGVYPVNSIRVAEAAKVIENAQRDINIAFMNELAIIFNRMGIDTKEVLEAAGTKWNFLKFTPGLVGGHCIGVDPYYLTNKAEQLGYHSQVILAGRNINDNMGKFIAENLVKKLLQAGINIPSSRVAILGLTFKEDCPDIRNTKVIDIINELNEYGIKPFVLDPQADPSEVGKEYNLILSSNEQIVDMDAIVIAVAHREFRLLSLERCNTFFRKDSNAKKVLIDVKGILDKKLYEAAEYIYWRL